MGSYIGIDLGTTFSALAVFDETGRPSIVHNAEGQNITPSCVAQANGSVTVGEQARRIWGLDETRAAARAQPFLYEALRAGVINYRAAADYLGLEGDTDAVATALRRFADDLPEYERRARSVQVVMESGLARDPNDSDTLLAVGETGFGGSGGSYTALLATGEVDAAALATALERLAVADVPVEAAGVDADALVVVVDRRDGPNALRVVEHALESVPA